MSWITGNKRNIGAWISHVTNVRLEVSFWRLHELANGYLSFFTLDAVHPNTVILSGIF